jgi:hypothetical protein
MKLVQLVKAIKSNIETEKKIDNTSGSKSEELRENNVESRRKEERRREELRENNEEKESKEENENNGARKNEEERDRERESESNDKINSKQDQSMKILENRTHNASDDHLDVLDVD